MPANSTMRIGLKLLCSVPQFTESNREVGEPIRCSLLAPDDYNERKAYLAQVTGNFESPDVLDEPLVDQISTAENIHIFKTIEAMDVWFNKLGIKVSFKTDMMRMFLAEVLEAAALGELVAVPPEYTGDSSGFYSVIDSIVLISQDPELFARKISEDVNFAPMSMPSDRPDLETFAEAMSEISRNINNL